MKAILCLDNRNGIMFNNRRLSRDKKIIDDIENTIKNDTLLCTNYSKELFENTNIITKIIDDDFLLDENKINYIFIEDKIPNYESIKEMIIYFWNRDYPSDTKFSPNFEKYDEIFTMEFEGNSHEIITKRVYIKKGETDGNSN